MSSEGLKSGIDKDKVWPEGTKLEIYRNKAGKFWYPDGTGSVILTRKENVERARQEARGRGTKPKDGMPEFVFRGVKGMGDPASDASEASDTEETKAPEAPPEGVDKDNEEPAAADPSSDPEKSPEPADASKDSKPESEPKPETEPKVEDAPKEPDEKLSEVEIKAVAEKFRNRTNSIQDALFKLRDEGRADHLLLARPFYRAVSHFEDLINDKNLTKDDVERLEVFLTDLESRIAKDPKKAADESPKSASAPEATPETFEQNKAWIQELFDNWKDKLKNKGTIIDPDYQKLVQDEIDKAKNDRDLDEVYDRLRTHAPWKFLEDEGTQSATRATEEIVMTKSAYDRLRGGGRGGGGRDNIRRNPAQDRGRPSASSWDVDPRDREGITAKSITEIRNNPQYQQDFGIVLEGLLKKNPGSDINLEDFLARSAEGEHKLSPQERLFQRKAQYEFTKSLKIVEEYNGMLQMADIDEARRRHPMLDAFMLNNEPERNMEILKNINRRAAMKDRGSVEETLKAYKNLNKRRDTARFRYFESEMQEICARAKVKVPEFNTVFDMKDRQGYKETITRLKERTREDMGGVRKAFDWVMGGVNMSSANRLARRAFEADLRTSETWHSPTSWVVADVNEHLDTIAKFSAAVVEDPELVRQAAREGWTGEKIKLAEEAGPTTVEQTMQQRNSIQSNELSEAKINTYWQRDIKEQIITDADGTERKWNQWSEPEREAFRSNWVPAEEQQRESTKAGRGSFARMLFGFLSNIFRQRKQKLSTANIPNPA